MRLSRAVTLSFSARHWKRALRQMWPTQILSGLLVVVLLGQVRQMDSQANDTAAQNSVRYNLSVSVDEVDLTFHASDLHSAPVNDLKLDELNLLDDGKPPRSILVFQSLADLPIRAGVLMDTSSSMENNRLGGRAIATRYAQQLLRQKTDQAFVMEFGDRLSLLQDWTSDIGALTSGIRRVAGGPGTTAIFDAVYSACRYQFGKVDHASYSNLILLFSDGEDNASYLPLKQAVDMCQRTNTAIYAFRAESKPGLTLPGPRTLAELASETGGRVFHDDDSDAEVIEDLHIIEADLRNRYRLVYRPDQLKPDGSFHRIQMRAPERVDKILIRTGYYAPKR